MITPGKHQREAVNRFIGLDYCFIGDSMGTGKTLTGVLLDFAERGSYPELKFIGNRGFRTLIVCTKGGLSVWKWHLEDQGVPSDRILVIDPNNRGPFDAELNSGANNFDYFIVHYHGLPLLSFFEKPQIGRNALIWHHIIADEVHLAKNRNAARTKVLKRQKARKKTALSGTPADNSPLDIWSVLNWLDKKTYSSYWQFYNEYIKYEEKVNHNTGCGYREVLGTKNMDKYHQKVAPFYIRRTLEEVRGSMPPKTHSEIWVDLSARQLKDYRQIKEFQTALLGRFDEELVIEWQIAIWQRLQQMTLGTVIELDWSIYEKFWEKWLPIVEAARIRGIDPDLPKNAPTGPKLVLGEPSPKIDAVMEKIDEAVDAGESIVVFTQYKEVVKMLESRCRKAKLPTSLYHGGITSQQKRDAAVADFQSRKTRVFVGTIGAAGTSITLTAAHTLIFTDRHWNPSINRQAEDRIWRLDQQSPCQIIDILAHNTLDDDKLDSLALKGRRVDAIVEVPQELKGVSL